MATSSRVLPYSTTINDLPEVILSNVIAAVTDVRSRNAVALVCRKWRLLERYTRTSLTLRGIIRQNRDILHLPTCFRSVTHLDLSLLSPWGHPLLTHTTPNATIDPTLIAHSLGSAFPLVTSLTLYARNPSTLELLAPYWPRLKHVKLVRWHQRPQQLSAGYELNQLFSTSKEVESLDLSTFYCWTDDIPPALDSNPEVSSKITSLNLMNPSLSEGFKSDDIVTITKSCPNLMVFKIACVFDPRYFGYVGDEGIASIGVNCPKLTVLQLADISALQNGRGDLDDEGYSNEDVRISVATLIELFSKLPLIEELGLDFCNNVRDSGPALEVLNRKCPKLRSLRLGQFHGISLPVESKLEGVALCQRLESLSIRNVGDLDDMGLIAIGRGCCRLAKFEVQGCKKITVQGMRTVACLLRKTLVDVRISCCKNLGAVSSLKALEPIQHQIQRLHIDCIWDSVEESEDLDNGFDTNFDLNKLDNDHTDIDGSSDYDSMSNKRKKCKYSYDLNMEFNGNGNGFYGRTWDRLQHLSLWIAAGELLTPLTAAGLEECPNLEEIRIKVEGDSRGISKLTEHAFGLSTLVNYPQLTKMHFDCGDVIGYAHTAPTGQMDLSSWERFFLFDIRLLTLTELDYWPPQDRDVNQRSLSLPAAALLQQCLSLRKLFIHGTAHEHFMMFFLKIPDLRDVQLREDYYPAPENDMSTEMRADSLSRFENGLNNRRISD